MGLLKTGACFTQELKLPANKVEIAKTFVDCAGSVHIPGDAIPSCDDMAAAITASQQAISISGSTITLSGGGSTPSTAIIPAAPAAAPQTLSISGQNLSISGGNTVTLPDNDTQDLSIAGNVISLTNGGSVTLPTATAPTLSVSGQNLTISGGNTVVLPAGTVADGSETKVAAGANVTVTGAGTTASPYVVTAASAVSTPMAVEAEYISAKNTDDVEATTPAYVRAAIQDRFQWTVNTQHNHGSALHPAGEVLNDDSTITIPTRPYPRTFTLTATGQAYAEMPCAIPTLGMFVYVLADTGAGMSSVGIGYCGYVENNGTANTVDVNQEGSMTYTRQFTVPANTSRAVTTRAQTTFNRPSQQPASQNMWTMSTFTIQEA
jgi:hypothetical protein